MSHVLTTSTIGFSSGKEKIICMSVSGVAAIGLIIGGVVLLTTESTSDVPHWAPYVMFGLAGFLIVAALLALRLKRHTCDKEIDDMINGPMKDATNILGKNPGSSQSSIRSRSSSITAHSNVGHHNKLPVGHEHANGHSSARVTHSLGSAYVKHRFQQLTDHQLTSTRDFEDAYHHARAMNSMAFINMHRMLVHESLHSGAHSSEQEQRYDSIGHSRRGRRDSSSGIDYQTDDSSDSESDSSDGEKHQRQLLQEQHARRQSRRSARRSRR